MPDELYIWVGIGRELKTVFVSTCPQGFKAGVLKSVLWELERRSVVCLMLAMMTKVSQRRLEEGGRDTCLKKEGVPTGRNLL
jgi:hypothetical protein